MLLVYLAAAALVGLVRGAEVSPELQLMTSRRSTCVYERAFGMYGVHCGGLKLTAVPRNLKSGIEILDASDNKIRELRADTFSGYSSVRYLYLEENHIFLVSPDAFAPLTYMETLDLSQNAITSLPNSLLQLPSLRKLQLGGNALIHWDSELATLQKPIKAPLEFLDLSDCRLTGLPDLGTLPELKIYNVSDNPLAGVEARSFAVTCKLATVDLTRSVDGVPLCALKPVVEWLSLYNVYFVLDDYSRVNTNEFQQCSSATQAESSELNATHSACRTLVVSTPVYRTTRQTWLSITGGLAGFLVAFMLLLYVMHRRNVAQTRRATKHPPPPPPAADRASDKPTTNLLSDVC